MTYKIRESGQKKEEAEPLAQSCYKRTTWEPPHWIFTMQSARYLKPQTQPSCIACGAVQLQPCAAANTVFIFYNLRFDLFLLALN